MLVSQTAHPINDRKLMWRSPSTAAALIVIFSLTSNSSKPPFWSDQDHGQSSGYAVNSQKPMDFSRWNWLVVESLEELFCKWGSGGASSPLIVHMNTWNLKLWVNGSSSLHHSQWASRISSNHTVTEHIHHVNHGLKPPPRNIWVTPGKGPDGQWPQKPTRPSSAADSKTAPEDRRSSSLQGSSELQWTTCAQLIAYSL